MTWNQISQGHHFGGHKTSHKTSTIVTFHDITFGGFIKAGRHRFDFGGTTIEPSNNDITHKDHHTDNDGDTNMIPTNLSKRDKISPMEIRNLISNHNSYSTQVMK